MSWTLSTGATATGSGADFNLIVPPVPSGVVSGDMLMATILYDRTSSITPPAGWTLQETADDGYVAKLAIYTAPGGTVTNTWTQKNFPNAGFGQISCLHSGGTVVIDTQALGSAVDDAAAITSPVVETTTDDDVLFVFSLANHYETDLTATPETAGYDDWNTSGEQNFSIFQGAFAYSTIEGSQGACLFSYNADFIVAQAITIAFAPGASGPTVSAGTDQTVTGPAPATLSGSVTWGSGHSGTVAWTAITGGAPAITSGSTTIAATIANSGSPFAAETYTYKLTATQDDSETANSEVTLTVNPPPTYRASGGQWVGDYQPKRASAGSWE